MRTCFSAAWLCLLSFPLARAASTGERVQRVTTVVRADLKTGRLVRNVVVTPKPVVAKVVQPRKPDQPPVRRFGPDTTLREIVRETARVHNLEPALVEAVVEVESNYNPFAISSKGAEGLMQLMPSTARRFGVGNSFDAEKNIEGGVRYLKYLQGLYGNDLQRVLAAYNAGEGAVNRYNGIPRYRETENYVYQVGRKLGEKRAAAKESKPAQAEQPALQHRPLEIQRDAEGRIYLRTR